jgi:hypothetical protein
MKKYTGRAIFALIITAILFSCKKSSTKDIAQSIKDKTWWGQLTYTGKPAEYYSVQFNADNSLVWSQLTGDYAGHWVLEGKTLTITFTGNTVQIKADISDDDKLLNITDNTTASEINSGQLIIDPNISLDNTTWKGSLEQGPNPSVNIQLKFIPGSKVEFNAINLAVTYNYTRTSSGAVIRFSTFLGPIFGIITTSSEMKGIEESGLTSVHYQWQAAKQ